MPGSFAATAAPTDIDVDSHSAAAATYESPKSMVTSREVVSDTSDSFTFRRAKERDAKPRKIRQLAEKPLCTNLQENTAAAASLSESCKETASQHGSGDGHEHLLVESNVGPLLNAGVIRYSQGAIRCDPMSAIDYARLCAQP